MLITPDEARRIAASIAKLLTPLKRRHVAKATPERARSSSMAHSEHALGNGPLDGPVSSHMETSPRAFSVRDRNHFVKALSF